MTTLLYANNAVGTLAAPITNASTSVTLNPGQAALFPAPTAGQAFYATFTDAGTQTIKEIVLVTAVAGNIFSITRAQDGTSALSWNQNDIISQNTIAAELRSFLVTGQPAAVDTLTASGLITPSSTIGIAGTTTNNNAQAGSVGEFQTNTNSGNAMVSGTPQNATSVSLTAGDWDVWGLTQFVCSSGVVQQLTSGVSTTAGTFGALGSTVSFQANFNSGSTNNIPAPVVRFSLAVTTTVFLVAAAVFGTPGAMTNNAVIYARRAR